ncbi:MAG: DUF2953 domain-containing protein [Methanosarcinaceae archaeon]
MLLIIYAALAIIVLFIGLMVFAAFDVTIDVKVERGRVKKHIMIKWMGLSYKPGNKPGKSEKAAKKETKKTKPKKENPGKKKGDTGISTGIRLLSTIQKPVIRFIEDILRTVSIKKISCDMTYGFSDPADTGIVTGFLHAVKGFFAGRCNVFDFHINPQFQDEMLDIHVLTIIRFRIILLIFALLRFMGNRKVLGASWMYFRERRMSKTKTF